MSDVKETILLKLQKLEELINKNHDSGEDLFPTHWLILLTVKDDLNKNGIIPRDSLECMNKIWKINKSIEKAGSAVQFEADIWEEIKKLTPALGWEGKEKGFNDMPKAIKLFKESFVKDDGIEFSLSEATAIITDKKDGSSS